MGIKNNFSQAVSELMGASKTVDAEPAAKMADELEQNEKVRVEAVAEEEMVEETEEETKSSNSSSNNRVHVNQEASSAQGASSSSKERILAMLAQQKQAQQMKDPEIVKETPKEAPGQTKIAKGTVIIGEINADGDVELLGSVRGKVTSLGDIKVNGKVIGDLSGKDIELIACAVQGNILASGLVSVDGDSIVIGDIKSENFCLDGKIKGNVTVEKEAKFQPKAILSGNVTTTSIAMSQGAKIQGEVNIPLSEKESNTSFDVEIVI